MFLLVVVGAVVMVASVAMVLYYPIYFIHYSSNLLSQLSFNYVPNYYIYDNGQIVS